MIRVVIKTIRQGLARGGKYLRRRCSREHCKYFSLTNKRWFTIIEKKISTTSFCFKISVIHDFIILHVIWFWSKLYILSHAMVFANKQNIFEKIKQVHIYCIHIKLSMFKLIYIHQWFSICCLMFDKNWYTIKT